MNLDYDIFELLPNGTALWRDFVRGLDAVLARLNKLANYSDNEFFAVDLATNRVAARANAKS
ncbi:MAG TPA: hypothetical protein VMF66_09210 [Candidatus Acidoferrum sp.]|nr:hypothetical protein [Candidatus Acidoferrum sp.]